MLKEVKHLLRAHSFTSFDPQITISNKDSYYALFTDKEIEDQGDQTGKRRWHPRISLRKTSYRNAIFYLKEIELALLNLGPSPVEPLDISSNSAI